MTYRFTGIVATIVMWAVVAANSLAAEPDSAGIEFFETKIRPVLVTHCLECHSSASASLKGGLQLDHRAGVLKGGDSGPIVATDNPDNSLLLKALKYDGLEMPPKGK